MFYNVLLETLAHTCNSLNSMANTASWTSTAVVYQNRIAPTVRPILWGTALLVEGLLSGLQGLLGRRAAAAASTGWQGALDESAEWHGGHLQRCLLLLCNIGRKILYAFFLQLEIVKQFCRKFSSILQPSVDKTENMLLAAEHVESSQLHTLHQTPSFHPSSRICSWSSPQYNTIRSDLSKCLSSKYNGRWNHGTKSTSYIKF